MNKMKFLSFEESKKIVTNLGLNGLIEWKKFRKSNLSLSNIPLCPNCVYKTEWKGWRDWLGTKVLPFQKAREIARSANLNQKRDWQKYVEAHRNLRLPTNPNTCYENDGWINWYDFLGKSTEKRRHIVNDSFFKTWSHDMAYILGLWWADGWVYDSLFSIVLQRKDCYLLHKILEKMSSTYPVREYNNYGVFNIRSKEIVNDIKNIGGTEKKSLTIDFPTVPSCFLSDFIRGLWDGDGCIHANNKTRICRASIASGSKVFIYKLHNILKENINNLGGSIVKHKGTNCYSLTFSKNDAINLRNLLYSSDSDLFLIRKRDKFVSVGKITFLQTKDMMVFKDAKEFVKKYGFKNSNEWNIFWKNNKKPLNLPLHPYVTYKNRGWISWSDFLGN